MPVSTPVFENLAGTPANPQFAEVVYHGHSVESGGANRAFVNILHFARTAGPGVDSQLALGNAVIGILDGALLGALSDTYIGDSVTSRFMDSPLVLPTVIPHAVAGAIGGDRAPDFAAVVTRKKTAGRGRSFRGSNHWGPIAESDTTKDLLNAAAILRWDAVAVAITFLGVTGAVLAADTWKLIVLSSTLSDLVVNPSVFTGAFVNGPATANTIVGTMRRRKQRPAAQ